MKSAVAIVASLFPLISAFSPSPETSVSVSRREIGKTIVSGGACLIATGSFVSPSLAAEEGEYITTDAGIQYKVMKPPTDPSSPTPVRGQKVKAKYALYLNGFPEDTTKAKQVDSSKGAFGEKPFEFPVGVSQVIKGWDLTVLTMRIGEARRIIVPYELGYGQYGASSIPERATLYFDVELAEMGMRPKITEEQEKWLADNPL